MSNTDAQKTALADGLPAEFVAGTPEAKKRKASARPVTPQVAALPGAAPLGLPDADAKAKAEIAEQQAARKAAKASKRIAKLKGETKAMPKTGKDAVAAIKGTAAASKARKPAKAAAAASKTIKGDAKLAKAKRASGAAKGSKTPSKSDVAEKMLLSKNGATKEELAKATGWPSVNLKTATERAVKAGRAKSLVENEGRFRLV